MTSTPFSSSAPRRFPFSRRLTLAAALGASLGAFSAGAQTPAPASPATQTAPSTSSRAERAERAAGLPPSLVSTPARQTSIRNDEFRPDTDGIHINAHGGGVLYHRGTYYWYGEYRNPRRRGQPGTQGVGCYSSTDLLNWKHEGVVMRVSDDPDSDITAGCVVERPKVIYNEKTGKFVLWFHLELKGRGYAAARTASAVSDSPTGPFTFIRSLRPNAGVWPVEFPKKDRKPLTPEETKELMAGDNYRPALRAGAYTRRDFTGGQMARDMTLFVDDDGGAYLIASAEENYTLAIHELTPDYLDFTGKWTRVAPGGHNEAPAVVKHKGRYHLLASGCTGWDPNPARVLTADSIWGPWTHSHNPCEGENPRLKLGPSKTWGGQSTHIFKVQGQPDAYVAMFDIWRPANLIESGYIWVPVEFENDKMVLRWRDEWSPAGFARRQP